MNRAWVNGMASSPLSAASQAGTLPGSRRVRAAWLAAGWLCLLIGTAGIVLPLVPTVDFYGLAAWCFVDPNLVRPAQFRSIENHCQLV